MTKTKAGAFRWYPANEAPEGVVVMTKIDDEKGIRNVQMLQRRGRLWFYDDMSMYVYYTPTHYAMLTGAKTP